jgi:hypothetical protein
MSMAIGEYSPSTRRVTNILKPDLQVRIEVISMLFLQCSEVQRKKGIDQFGYQQKQGVMEQPMTSKAKEKGMHDSLCCSVAAKCIHQPICFDALRASRMNPFYPSHIHY